MLFFFETWFIQILKDFPDYILCTLIKISNSVQKKINYSRKRLKSN